MAWVWNTLSKQNIFIANKYSWNIHLFAFAKNDIAFGSVRCEQTLLYTAVCYRPQTKFAKVMFLQVSVHKGGEGVHGCSGGGHAWFCPGGAMHSFVWGGYTWFFLGGMCGFFPGAVWFFSGERVWFFQVGACVVRRIRRDTVNEWAVRILLECILVTMCVYFFFFCFIMIILYMRWAINKSMTHDETACLSDCTRYMYLWCTQNLSTWSMTMTKKYKAK